MAAPTSREVLCRCRIFDRHNHLTIDLRLPTLRQIGDAFRRYANPLYHLRKLREDLGAMWHALRLHLDGRVPDETSLAKAFRGKLMACFWLSGPTSWIGWSLSYYLQRRFENPLLGQYSVPAINMVVTTFAYQVFWWLGNRELYRGEGGFRRFERDLLPVHGNGIRIGMSFNLVTWPLTSLLLLGIQFLNQRAAVAIPAVAVQQAVDAIFVNTTFMRLMGDFFERWSVVLASRHIENEIGPPRP